MLLVIRFALQIVSQKELMPFVW